MPTSFAATIPSKQAPSLVIAPAPFPTPLSNQLIIRTLAVAINPIDRGIQTRGDIVFTHLKYPFTPGYDAAGEVIAIGSTVTRFRPGDRVVGFCRGAEKEVNDSAEGAFQNYTVLCEDFTTKIPQGEKCISLAQASVLPLGIATAATALFDDSQLGLTLPAEPARPSRGETVIIWGGSASVGCCAIQMAVAAGYEVFTTASPHNHDLLRSLGASKIWDYKSATVAEDMAFALRGRITVGAVAIGPGAAEACMQILVSTNAVNKFVSMTTFPVSLDDDPGCFPKLDAVKTMASWTGSYKLKGLWSGVKSEFVNIGPIFENGIARHLFAEYLGKALERGTFVAAPKADIVGHGLEIIQEAMEIQRKGVSGRKIVVTLGDE